ncbi:CD9 antigen-like isoform X3 [Erpetoichthys calabaricus]|uniref:CD9 antigen-like isoform X3 n=1 Tax=Erpetoichthys calabaricus TaxID=27687 RepID=UPI002234049D|nr:CD9 antigen-like isoform X3 [Erpetoichthys calabaricus]
MARDSCGYFYKCVCIILSFIYGVAGLVLGGLGIWLRLSSMTRGLFDVILDTKQFIIVVILLIAVGLTLLCFSISSLCGACAESLEGIYIAGLFLGFLLAKVFVGGILAFILKNTVAENLGEIYTVVYLKYLNTRDLSLAITLKLFHNMFDCCGVAGGVLEPFVHETCQIKGIWGQVTTMACPQLIPNKFNSSGVAILYIFIAVAAFMVMTAIFNGILLTAIKKDKNQVSQEALPLHMHMNNF